jgi:hypothetical protein
MKKTRTNSRKRGSKENRRIKNIPAVEFVAKLPKRPNPGKEFDLRERGRRNNRVVEFPQMKGRTIQTVRFYSSPEENTVSIRFRDQTVLSLYFEPGLVLRSDLIKTNRWDAETIKEWPPIHSTPRNPEI